MVQKVFLGDVLEVEVQKEAVIKGDYMAKTKEGLIIIVRANKEFRDGEWIKTKITTIRSKFCLGDLYED